MAKLMSEDNVDYTWCQNLSIVQQGGESCVISYFSATSPAAYTDIGVCKNTK